MNRFLHSIFAIACVFFLHDANAQSMSGNIGLPLMQSQGGTGANNIGDGLNNLGLTKTPSINMISPIGDQITGCAAGYGLMKIKSSFSGSPIQMRVQQSGSPVLLNIPFLGNYVDVRAADTFAATRDSGTYPEIRFYDQCGSGYDSTFVTSVQGAHWSPNSINGYRFASFDIATGGQVSGGNQGLALPSGLALNEDTFSFAYIGQALVSYPLYATTFFEVETPQLQLFNWYASLTGCSSTGSGMGIYSSQISTAFCAGNVESTPGLYAYVGAATTANYYINDRNISLTKTAIGATSSGGGYLGRTSTSTANSDELNALGFIFWNKTLSATEVVKLQNYAYQLTGYAELTMPTLWGIGDSTLNNNGLIENNNWFYDTANFLNTKFRLYVDATSGETAADKLSKITRITSLYKSGVMNAAYVQMGYNDVVAGATVSQAIASDTALCDALHSAGFYPVIAVPSQHTATTGSLLSQATQDALWNGLATAYVGHCDAIAGNWADPVIGSSSDPTNTAYYNSDQEHMTAAGHAIMAQYTLAALKPFVR